ncbi:hypothetical protein DVK02_11340 [Halobellus sp. Atlit-31R]|nr:hypothetical protein DVK02_11340 [Halobellus sp. Atlit-31R]
MQRRKLLIGMASLAAGGAATVGTGALSSVQAQRKINGTIVGDEKAYLEINGYDTSENSFAVETSGNELSLNFGRDGDYDKFNDSNTVGNDEAEGLNPDAISSFDRVFRIQNDGTEPLHVYIEDSLEDVSWYGTRADGESYPNDGEPTLDQVNLGAGGNSIEGRSNAVTLLPFDEEAVDDNGNALDDSGDDPGVSELDVGVVFDLRGQTSTGDVFGSDDNFTIIADDDTNGTA